MTWAALGRPAGAGWIAGDDLRDAGSGPFNDLLRRIGHSARTTDRRTIAASFAMRFGWASAIAVEGYLRHRCVSDVALGNTSFLFGPSTAFERAVLHERRGWCLTSGDADVALVAVPDMAALRRALRATLTDQAAPIVEALFRWSGFARRGTWGLLTSAWVSQFTTYGEPRDDQRALVPELAAFFAGDDLVSTMRPRLRAVSVGGATHLVQRRASCCRMYLLPGGELCVSCPLVADDDGSTRGVRTSARAPATTPPGRFRR
jgi:hypothetical protein